MGHARCDDAPPWSGDERTYPETGCDVSHFRGVATTVGDQEGDDPARRRDFCALIGEDEECLFRVSHDARFRYHLLHPPPANVARLRKESFNCCILFVWTRSNWTSAAASSSSSPCSRGCRTSTESRSKFQKAQPLRKKLMMRKASIKK